MGLSTMGWSKIADSFHKENEYELWRIDCEGTNIYAVAKQEIILFVGIRNTNKIKEVKEKYNLDI